MTSDDAAPPLEALLAHRAWVRSLACRLAGDAVDADDLEQDAWLAAVRARPKDGTGIRAWFAKVMRNRAAEKHRLDVHRAAREAVVARAEGTPGSAELVIDAEAHARVVGAVLGLDEPWRETVLLRFYEGLPPRAVAARMDVPVDTVRTRLRRAAEMLRDALGGQRRDWLSAVAPLVCASRRLQAPSAAAVAGGLAMGLTSKLVAVGAVIALVVAIALRPTSDDPLPGERPAAPAALAPEAPRAEAPRATPRRDPAATRFGIDGRVTSGGAGVRARVAADRMGPSRTALEWSGVRVQALAAPPAASGDADARTDSSGAFSLDGLNEGTYRLTATLTDGRRAVRLVELTPEVPRARVGLSPPDGGNVLRGRVVTADGAPFAGWVRLHQNVIEDATWTRTDEAGAFGFAGLLPVRTHLLVTEEGAPWSATTSLQLPFDGELVVTVDLGPVLRKGRVVAAHDGTPVPRAEITVRSGAFPGTRVEQRVISGADGAFEVRCERRAGFWVSAPGFVRAFAEDDGKSDEFVVRLTRCASVSGRVVRSDGTGPVEGAVVRARPATDRDWVRERRTPSAPDGTFRIEDAVPGEAEVYVLGGGWVSPDLAKARRGGFDPFVVRLESGSAAGIELRAKPAGRAVGKVVDADGVPVPDIAVSAGATPYFDGVPYLYADTRAGAGGEFVLDGLIPGIEYSFRAYRPFEIATRGAPLLVTSGNTTEVMIRLDPERRVQVSVLEDGTSAPVAGAIVSLAPAGTRTYGDWGTDAAGNVDAGPVGSGAIVVRAKAAGYVESQSDVPAEDVDATHLRATVRLARARPIVGRVEVPEGVRFEDVRISAQTDPALRGGAPVARANTSPAADGSFRFDTLPDGAYVLSAWARGEESFEASVKARTGTVDVLLTLGAGQSVPGRDRVAVRVLDADGQPVAAASISCVFVHDVARMDGSNTTHRQGVSIGSGSAVRDGVAAVAVPPRDRAERWLEVRRADVRQGATHSGAAVVRLADPLPAQVDVRLPPERRISGSVIGPDGKGVPGVRVVAQPHSGAAFQWYASTSQEDHGAGMTDAGGSFTVGRLGEFTYRLSVTVPPGFAPVAPMKIAAGTSGVEVRLLRGMEPTVTVVGPDGAPLAWCNVMATTIVPAAKFGSEDSSYVSANTAADGTAKLPALDPEIAYQLSVSPPQGRDDLLHFSVASWAPADLRVQLEPAAAISGVVRDAAGHPVPRAIVWYQNVSTAYSGTARAAAGADGRFRIVRLARGAKYRVRALPEGAEDRGQWAVVDGVAATAGDENVILVLDAGDALRVRVVGIPPGVAAPYAVRSIPRVSSNSGGGSTGVAGSVGSGRELRVPSDGLIVLGDLPANATHRIFVGPTETGLYALSDEFLPGGQDVTLRMVQGEPLTGRVAFPPGVEAREVFLYASGDGWMVSATVAADGQFRFAGLPPNATRLDASVYRGGRPVYRGTATGPTAGVVLDLQSEGGR